MNEHELPFGLRHVLIHVTAGEQTFPPRPNSEEDIALMRAGNRSRQKKAKGVEDAFVFVTSRANFGNDEATAEALAAYGFSNASCLTVESSRFDVASDDEYSDANFQDEIEEIGIAIDRWLQENHPGAVAFAGMEYQEANFWWSGVEQNVAVFNWPFDTEAYAKSLPDVHRMRADTWLNLLGHAVKLDEIQADSPDCLGLDQAAAWAATLCDWLHGFEAASGNGFNYFSDDYATELMPSEFFLGFEFGRISGDGLDWLCGEHDSDIQYPSMTAMQTITMDRRRALRTALSDFFGSDSILFWALYSAIWPSFDKPIIDAVAEKLGSSSYEDIAELEAPWRYVSDGWCDHAD